MTVHKIVKNDSGSFSRKRKTPIFRDFSEGGSNKKERILEIHSKFQVNKTGCQRKSIFLFGTVVVTFDGLEFKV